MKNGLVKFFLFGAILAIAGCKEDVPTLFNQQDGIYFTSKDSVAYTFAKYPSRVTDTIKLAVNVLGNAATVDREIAIEKATDQGSSAVEGVHYKLLQPYKVPANSYSTLLPIVIYRTPDMDVAPVNLVLKLAPNSNFQAGLSAKTSLKVNIGYLQKPATWGEIGGIQWAGYSTNFGTWTKTKYKLILDALYDPVSDTTVSEFPYSRFSAPASYLQYLQLVKNYIRTNYPGNYSNPIGIGPTLRDPDANNAVIQVGPANY